jgi:kynurenine formamidase
MNRFQLGSFFLAVLCVHASAARSFGQNLARSADPNLVGSSAAATDTVLPPTVPLPGPDGWGPGDERGNGNTQGHATRLRCAAHLVNLEARVYELGRVLSSTMPQSPFGDGPVGLQYLPTRGIPFTSHAGNGEVFSGGLGSQGTQFDALGHFGFLDAPWPGSDPFPAAQVRYYNGFRQAQVKPTTDAPLLKLGVDKAVPIVTSAVMLVAKAYRGRRLDPGELVTAADIRGMLHAQGLQTRGILPGDAVFVHTGWGELWTDPAPDPASTEYYSSGPGLAVDAQEYLASRTVVMVALDNPFTDPFPTPPPPQTLPSLPFGVHHNNLTQHGIHQIQNLVLAEMARDGVSLSCAIVLPLRIAGGAGSTVRPIAVGVPRR